MRGVGDVELKNRGRVGKFARSALRERKTAAGAGKYHLGPFFLSKFCDAKCQRCIGEYARDDNTFSCENSHALDRSSPVLAEVGLKVLLCALGV